MKYNVLILGYKDPNPERVKDLLEFEKTYLDREAPGKDKILIFSYVVLYETAEINAETLKKARKGREEYNIDASDLDTVYDPHGVHRMQIEV